MTQSSEGKVVIRDARPEDAAAAGEIAARAWAPIREAFTDRLGKDIAAGFGDMKRSKYDQVHRFITKTPQDAVVAEIDGKIVGFATTHLHSERDPNTPTGELGNNAVHPEFGGRGIGRLQGEACIRKLIERGAKVLKVFTGLDEGHAPARRLYEKLGFDKKLEHVEYYMTVEHYLEEQKKK